MENVTTFYTIEQWNADLAEQLIPHSILLSIYIFLGVFGNLLVIVVYKCGLRRASDERYFIPVLAMSDLSATTVCASFGIALNMMQAQFTNSDLCKAWWFFAAFTIYLSILLLVFIAFHRYLIVCGRPGKDMTLFWKRFAIVCAIFLAAIVAFPTAFLYGSVNFQNSGKQIVGKRCSKLQDSSKVPSLVFSAVLGFVLLILILVICYCYGKIGWTVYYHMQNMKQEVHKGPLTSDQFDRPSKLHTKDSDDFTTNLSSDLHRSIEDKTDKETSFHYAGDLTKQSTIRAASKLSKNDKWNGIRNRLTLMYMIMTLVFIVSFIPTVVLVILEGRNPQFWENISDSHRAAVLLLYRSYIISNVVNPFIYGFMDSQFRNELKIMFNCLKDI